MNQENMPNDGSSAHNQGSNFDFERNQQIIAFSAEISRILGGRTLEEITRKIEYRSRNSFEQYKAYLLKLEELVHFLKTKEKLISKIRATTPEGKTVNWDISNELSSWKVFFESLGVDWVTWPREMRVSESDGQRMTELVEKAGFDKLMIIPENLVGFDPQFMEGAVDDQGRLYRNIVSPSEYYAALYEIINKKMGDLPYATNNTGKLEGGFAGTLDLRSGPRILLYKDEEGVTDPYSAQTGNKSWEEVQVEVIKDSGLSALTLSECLLVDFEHFLRTKQFLFSNFSNICGGSLRPAYGRIPTFRRGVQKPVLRVESRLPDKGSNSDNMAIATKVVGVVEPVLIDF